MSDNDLLDRFDAKLPRLKMYQVERVPAAGSKELEKYQAGRLDTRMAVLVSGIMAVMFGLMAMLSYPVIFWVSVACVVVGTRLAVTSGGYYLQLVFDQRPEGALPAGTNIQTAQLEEGTLSLIRQWNADAFDWNRRVAVLRIEFIDWKVLVERPVTRGIEWSEASSKTHADALIVAVQGLSADRSALVARQEVINRRLRNLEALLLRLKASEEAPALALPPPKQDNNDDG